MASATTWTYFDTAKNRRRIIGYHSSNILKRMFLLRSPLDPGPFHWAPVKRPRCSGTIHVFGVELMKFEKVHHLTRPLRLHSSDIDYPGDSNLRNILALVVTLNPMVYKCLYSFSLPVTMIYYMVMLSCLSILGTQSPQF